MMTWLMVDGEGSLTESHGLASVREWQKVEEASSTQLLAM